MVKFNPLMLSICTLCLLSACSNDAPSPGSPAAAVPAPADSEIPATTATAVPPTAVALVPWTTPATPATTSELCSLDAVSGVGSVNLLFNASVGQGITFEGWASAPEMQHPGNIAIILDGPTDFQVTGSTGVARDDVAAAFGAGLANAGFKLELSDVSLPPGAYAVSIGLGEPTSFLCNTKTTLIVG